LLGGEDTKQLRWGSRKSGNSGGEWYAFSSLPVDGAKDAGRVPELLWYSLRSRMRMPFSKYASVEAEEIPLWQRGID